MSLSSGVPQGSCLGPLLFVIFINNLADNLSPDVKRIIYADDTQIYRHCYPSDLSACLALLNLDASAVVRYAANNGLKLNSKKTTVIILGSEPNLRQVQIANLPRIVVSGSGIPFSESIKSLGVHISSKLDWTTQVDGLVRRVHATLYALRLYRGALSRPLRLKLVQSLALITPLLLSTICSNTWMENFNI